MGWDAQMASPQTSTFTGFVQKWMGSALANLFVKSNGEGEADGYAQDACHATKPRHAVFVDHEEDGSDQDDCGHFVSAFCESRFQ